MPEQQAPPIAKAVDLEVEKLFLGSQPVEDAYALEMVKQSFFWWEQYRTKNHDLRWQIHDQLYFGWLPQKVWDGTAIARSSLSFPLTFDQVESALPQITSALFPTDDWFQVSAEGGATPQEARGVQDRLRLILEHPVDDFGSNGKVELELASKDILMYGNGGVWLDYDTTLQRPTLEHISLLDLYIDPATPTPSIDQSRGVIRRKKMTVETLERYRENKDFRLPPTSVLMYMANNPQMVMADQTRQAQEAWRGVQYQPNTSDRAPLPSDRTIEVLIYESATRIIWVLNRVWTVYNKPNPYGFIRAAFAPCYIVPNRFYAMSVCDVQESNQRYYEALANAHIDELNLSLHPPRIQKPGGLATPSQLRWRPGLIQHAMNPKDDVLVQYPQQMTANVFPVLSLIEGAAEKRTGINSMSQSGVARPGNANRTATGMNLQAAGGSSRIMKIVENIENYLIVPMLYKLYKMDQMHSGGQGQLPALSSGPQGKVYSIPAASVYHPMRFQMQASSKMVTKDRLGQLVPFLAQYLMSGPLVSQLGKSGKTVDFDEFSQLVLDATNTPRLYKLIRPMTQEEQQAAQQPPPEVTAKMQEKQMDAQTRMQIMDKKVQGDLQKEVIKKQPDQGQFQMDMMKAQMDQKMKEMDLKIKAMEAQLKMEEGQAKIDLKKQELGLKQAEGQQKLQLQQAEGIQKQQQAQESHQMNLRQQMMDQLFNSQAKQQDHELKLGQQKEQGEQKLKQMKAAKEVTGQEKRAKAKPAK